MCGIIAIYGKDPSRRPLDDQEIAAALPGMLATLARRGPDEQTHRQLGPVWLGHTRLSIIDLHTGTQPVFNETRTVATILNGEIYNYRELRDHLRSRGHEFQTESDTEVIVHLYEEYGERLFEHLNGMFALVVYDIDRDILIAGRDRMGEKPVLVFETPEHLIIASELKAILAWPGVTRTIDPEALGLYLNMMCVPEPLCIFKGIVKLQPAHYLKLAGGRTSLHKYWDPRPRVNWSMGAQDARIGFLELFQDAVSRRLVSDVPLGVFLSGGIDSSAVTSFAAGASPVPVRTFAVGLAGDVDERPFARAVASHCGTAHTELFVRGDVGDAFPLVMDYFDEPFADSSSLPTFMVARAAREHVTVALTGDGGDELFAGYSSYADQRALRGTLTSTRIAQGAARLVGKLPPYDRRGGPWPRTHWRYVRSLVPAADMAKWLPGFPFDPDRFYDGHQWLTLEDRDPLSVAFAHDLNFYLPADLLKKVDMSAMLTSLECRAPFLDHRLVEFCMSIPPDLKMHGGQPKQLLKDILGDRLPREVLQRPKQGFGAPVLDWVRGPLNGIAQDLLQPGCRCEDWISPAVVRDVTGRVWGGAEGRDWRLPLQFWSILSLEWWLRRFM